MYNSILQIKYITLHLILSNTGSVQAVNATEVFVSYVVPLETCLLIAPYNPYSFVRLGLVLLFGRPIYCHYNPTYCFLNQQ